MFSSCSNFSLVRNFIPFSNFGLFGHAILQTIFLVVSSSHDTCRCYRILVLHLVIDCKLLIILNYQTPQFNFPLPGNFKPRSDFTGQRFPIPLVPRSLHFPDHGLFRMLDDSPRRSHNLLAFFIHRIVLCQQNLS